MSCLFCKIVRKEISASIVYETETLVAFRDIHPQAPVHILIIPKQHIPMLQNVDVTHTTLLGEMMLAAKNIAAQEGLQEGYRLILNVNEGGGQTVFHIHLHLLGGRTLTWPPG